MLFVVKFLFYYILISTIPLAYASTPDEVRQSNTPKSVNTTKMSRPILSTHVLDTSVGKPAVGVFVELYKQKDENWTLWHNTVTSSDGRVQFPFSKESMGEGTYKLKFKIGDYYERAGKETLYPYVEIVFKTKEDQHYHIPLLLTPYGYSTYRGS